jgi:hypothetical protein
MRQLRLAMAGYFYKMKSSKRKSSSILYVSILYCAMHIGACTEEEVIPVFPEYLQCDVNIGAFNLLPSSLTYTPYIGRDSVTYVDSQGAELVFLIREGKINTIQAAIIKYDVFEIGDTVRYCYQAEKKSFLLKNAKEDIELGLSIEAKPDYNNLHPGVVSDEFNIWYNNPDPPPFSSSQVFYATIDVRTASYSDNNIVIPQMEVFGKTFFNVEKTNFSNPAIIVWYNRTEGIVCFIDPQGRRWRWSGFK